LRYNYNIRRESSPEELTLYEVWRYGQMLKYKLYTCKCTKIVYFRNIGHVSHHEKKGKNPKKHSHEVARVVQWLESGGAKI
jgi:hypothetical protein